MRGQLEKAWRASCAGCGKVTFVNRDDKVKAKKELTDAGWSINQYCGLLCPKCKEIFKNPLIKDDPEVMRMLEFMEQAQTVQVDSSGRFILNMLDGTKQRYFLHGFEHPSYQAWKCGIVKIKKEWLLKRKEDKYDMDDLGDLYVRRSGQDSG